MFLMSKLMLMCQSDCHLGVHLEHCSYQRYSIYNGLKAYSWVRGMRLVRSCFTIFESCLAGLLDPISVFLACFILRKVHEY